jgi:cell division septal protein FtsQ
VTFISYETLLRLISDKGVSSRATMVFVSLLALVGFFFFGVAVVFVWVVLILFYQEKVPASGSAETLSPRSITCARYPKTGT